MISRVLTLVMVAILFFIAMPQGFSEQAFCTLRDGRPVDGKSVLEVQGKKYEFCCSGCLQQFKDSPGTFSKSLQTLVITEKDTDMAENACSAVCSD